MRLSWVTAMLGVMGGLFAITHGQTRSIAWQAERAETLKHFRALVQIDTSNPPGNERKLVEYLKSVLDAEGIASQTFALDPNRPNLVARLKGSGARRPLLMLAHTDVVPVQREKWPVDPFGAVVKDGYVWGRGTTDDKDKLTAILMTMLLVKRSGMALDRDLILLAEPAEEADTTGVGIRFMVEQHFDAIDAEFAVTEGPGVTVENGRNTVMQIATAEKLPRGVRLVASGPSGHGSVPRLDNAVAHLAAAVEKVASWRTPVRLNDTTRRYFDKLASISAPEQAARYRSILATSALPADVDRYLLQSEPMHASMLRTSIVPTMLQAGVGVNVIPSTAEAVLDIRALPDEDMTAFLADMRRVIDDPSIEIVPRPWPRPVAPPSSVDSVMFRALERATGELYPGATPLPMMTTGASDMAQLRAKGVQAYGIGPAMTADDFALRAWHSDVERLSEESLHQFVRFVWTAVTSVAQRQ